MIYLKSWEKVGVFNLIEILQSQKIQFSNSDLLGNLKIDRIVNIDDDLFYEGQTKNGVQHGIGRELKPILIGGKWVTKHFEIKLMVREGVWKNGEFQGSNLYINFSIS